MELVYASNKVKTQCTSVNAARKLFGGNNALAVSLIARITAMKAADTIKDIIVQPSFYFHKLDNKHGRNLEGYFAIDVKSRMFLASLFWKKLQAFLENVASPFWRKLQSHGVADATPWKQTFFVKNY